MTYQRPFLQGRQLHRGNTVRDDGPNLTVVQRTRARLQDQRPDLSDDEIEERVTTIQIAGSKPYEGVPISAPREPEPTDGTDTSGTIRRINACKRKAHLLTPDQRINWLTTLREACMTSKLTPEHLQMLSVCERRISERRSGGKKKKRKK